MKSVLIAAMLVGAATAGLIVYFTRDDSSKVLKDVAEAGRDAFNSHIGSGDSAVGGNLESGLIL